MARLPVVGIDDRNQWDFYRDVDGRFADAAVIRRARRIVALSG